MASLVRKFWMRKFWIGLCLAIVLIASSQMGVQASSLTDSRIRQLEAEVRSLQSQVSQLQSQRTGNSPIQPQPINPAPAINGLTLDQQFDNLANLVIEINQRVIALENRSSQQ